MAPVLRTGVVPPEEAITQRTPRRRSPLAVFDGPGSRTWATPAVIPVEYDSTITGSFFAPERQGSSSRATRGGLASRSVPPPFSESVVRLHPSHVGLARGFRVHGSLHATNGDGRGPRWAFAETFWQLSCPDSRADINGACGRRSVRTKERAEVVGGGRADEEHEGNPDRERLRKR